MKDEQIIDMCKRIASKYYKTQNYQDCLSEGILNCLELRDKGELDPHKLYHSARSIMWDYVNVKSSPLSYPKGSAGRLRAGEDTSEYIDFESAALIAKDLYGSYELKNSIEKLRELLSNREWKILMLLYKNDNNLTNTSKVLGVTKQAVEQVRNNIRDKLVTICELDISKI